MAEENEQASKYTSAISGLHLLHIRYLLIGQSKPCNRTQGQIVRALPRGQIQELGPLMQPVCLAYVTKMAKG